MRNMQIWSYLGSLMLGALVGLAWGRPVRAHDEVSFQVRRDYMMRGFPVSVTAGDLNSDGRPDLVEADEGGFVSILLGTGDGTFQACAVQIFHPTLINHSHEWGLCLSGLTQRHLSKVLVAQEATVIVGFQPVVEVHLIEIRCHQFFA
jgi:hypothetical protein